MVVKDRHELEALQQMDFRQFAEVAVDRAGEADLLVDEYR